NTSVHSTTSFTPFYLTHGYEYEPEWAEGLPRIKDITELTPEQQVEKARELAKAKIAEKQQTMKKYFDRDRKKDQLEIGDIVTHLVMTDEPAKKEAPRYQGLYRIESRNELGDYKLQSLLDDHHIERA